MWTPTVISLIFQHVSIITEPSSGRLQFLGEVKHPKTVYTYAFIDVQYNVFIFSAIPCLFTHYWIVQLASALFCSKINLSSRNV